MDQSEFLRNDIDSFNFKNQKDPSLFAFINSIFV